MAKRLDYSQKIVLAKQICKDMGTTLSTIDPGGNRVLKHCNTDPKHPSMEVELRSIINMKRGGCATCARSKGGQNSKRSKAKDK